MPTTEQLLPSKADFDKGFVCLPRKYRKRPWYRNPCVRLVFTELYETANYEQKFWTCNGKKIKILPGENITSIKALSENLGFTQKQIQNAIKILINDEVIEKITRDLKQVKGKPKGKLNYTHIKFTNWESEQQSHQAKSQTYDQTYSKQINNINKNEENSQLCEGKQQYKSVFSEDVHFYPSEEDTNLSYYTNNRSNYDQ